MVREESPRWLQLLESRWLNRVGDPQHGTSAHARRENRMALNKAFCSASCPIAGHWKPSMVGTWILYSLTS